MDDPQSGKDLVKWFALGGNPLCSYCRVILYAFFRIFIEDVCILLCLIVAMHMRCISASVYNTILCRALNMCTCLAF